MKVCVSNGERCQVTALPSMLKHVSRWCCSVCMCTTTGG